MKSRAHFVDVHNPSRVFPWERHCYASDHQLFPHIVYRYPTEHGRATHLDVERAVLARPTRVGP